MSSSGNDVSALTSVFEVNNLKQLLKETKEREDAEELTLLKSLQQVSIEHKAIANYLKSYRMQVFQLEQQLNTSVKERKERSVQYELLVKEYVSMNSQIAKLQSLVESCASEIETEFEDCTEIENLTSEATQNFTKEYETARDVCADAFGATQEAMDEVDDHLQRSQRVVLDCIHANTYAQRCAAQQLTGTERYMTNAYTAQHGAGIADGIAAIDEGLHEAIVSSREVLHTRLWSVRDYEIKHRLECLRNRHREIQLDKQAVEEGKKAKRYCPTEKEVREWDDLIGNVFTRYDRFIKGKVYQRKGLRKLKVVPKLKIKSTQRSRDLYRVNRAKTMETSEGDYDSKLMAQSGCATHTQWSPSRIPTAPADLHDGSQRMSDSHLGKSPLARRVLREYGDNLLSCADEDDGGDHGDDDDDDGSGGGEDDHGDDDDDDDDDDPLSFIMNDMNLTDDVTQQHTSSRQRVGKNVEAPHYAQPKGDGRQQLHDNEHGISGADEGLAVRTHQWHSNLREYGRNNGDALKIKVPFRVPTNKSSDLQCSPLSTQNQPHSQSRSSAISSTQGHMVGDEFARRKHAYSEVDVEVLEEFAERLADQCDALDVLQRESLSTTHTQESDYFDLVTRNYNDEEALLRMMAAEEALLADNRRRHTRSPHSSPNSDDGAHSHDDGHPHIDDINRQRNDLGTLGVHARADGHVSKVALLGMYLTEVALGIGMANEMDYLADCLRSENARMREMLHLCRRAIDDYLSPLSSLTPSMSAKQAATARSFKRRRKASSAKASVRGDGFHAEDNHRRAKVTHGGGHKNESDTTSTENGAISAALKIFYECKGHERRTSECMQLP
jgi:hypothetical protein